MRSHSSAAGRNFHIIELLADYLRILNWFYKILVVLVFVIISRIFERFLKDFVRISRIFLCFQRIFEDFVIISRNIEGFLRFFGDF